MLHPMGNSQKTCNSLFLRCVRCARCGSTDFSGVLSVRIISIRFDRVIGRGFRRDLVPDQQDGADRDRRVGDVEGGPVIAGDVPLDEIDHRAEANAVDDVAERSAKHEGERQRESELAGVPAQPYIGFCCSSG